MTILGLFTRKTPGQSGRVNNGASRASARMRRGARQTTIRLMDNAGRFEDNE